MSAVHGLLVELAAESEMAGGRFSFAFADDWLWRMAQVYDGLGPDDPDRLWCQLAAAVLTGVLSADEVRRVVDSILEALS